MARPFKRGLDYFPLDVVFDNGIELFEAECGLTGFAILVKLWQKIYAEGYYLDWNPDCIMLFAKRISTGVNDVTDVINACLRRGIFDNRLYIQYSILTSKAIQKRYFLACKDSKRKNISAIRNYLLIDGEYLKIISEMIELPVITHPVTELTPPETELTNGFSTQRKGKEIESKRDSPPYSPPPPGREVKKIPSVFIKKEDAKVYIDTRFTDPGVQQAMLDFVENRRLAKHPMTQRALELQCDRLLELSKDRTAQKKIIEQSVMNGWLSLVRLKDLGNGRPPETDTQGKDYHKGWEGR